jgi:uracil-DNA glycosylase
VTLRKLVVREPQILEAPVPLTKISVSGEPRERQLCDVAPGHIGVGSKPWGCNECPYKAIGSGFCPDDCNTEARVAMLLETPGEDEILYGKPLVGKGPRYWLWQLVSKIGHSRDELQVSHMLRCRAHGVGKPKDKWNDYPTGKLRTAAERYCRQYDEALVKFAPDAFIISMHPFALLRSPAFTRLMRKDVEKAFRLADKGYRPLLIMGDKAMTMCAPWLSGGVKKWRGHYWLGSLKTKYQS